MPSSDSLSWSVLPPRACCTTKLRNRESRSFRTNAALDKILSNCFRTSEAALDCIPLRAILPDYQCVSCVDNPSPTLFFLQCRARRSMLSHVHCTAALTALLGSGARRRYETGCYRTVLCT